MSWKHEDAMPFGEFAGKKLGAIPRDDRFRLYYRIVFTWRRPLNVEQRGFLRYVERRMLCSADGWKDLRRVRREIT